MAKDTKTETASSTEVKTEVKTETTVEKTPELAETPKEPTKAKKPNFKMSQIPGLFVSKAKHLKFDVYLYVNDEGEIKLILPDGLDDERKSLLAMQEMVISAEFTMPSRKQMENYRRKAGRWVEEAQSLITDRYTFRALLLRHHLVDINIPDPSTGDKIKVEIEGGRISDNTETILQDLHPTILEILLNKFVVQADLVF